MLEFSEVCVQHLPGILDGGKRDLSSQFPGSYQFSWKETLKRSAGCACSLPCSPTEAGVAWEDHTHPTGEGTPKPTAVCCSRHRSLSALN